MKKVKKISPLKKVSPKKTVSKKLLPRKTPLKKIFSKKFKKAKKISKGTKTRLVSALTLGKHPTNPILMPRPENGWESWQTFNPGVILLNDTVHFLYRAIGNDGISRFGYASSKDGYHIHERLFSPAYEHRVHERVFNIFSYSSGGSWGGAEDPRLVRVEEEDVLYMTYTACDGDLRVALTSIQIDDFLQKKWKWKPSILISPPGEVHKNWVLFPEKINGKYAILHSINPEVSVAYFDDLDFKDLSHIQSYHGNKPRTNCWDKWVRGVGAPPIKTKYGWLVFYHAMDNDWGKYKVGAMLLDVQNPTHVLARATEPVLEPSEQYENSGFKAGVVYVSGAVVKDGELLVYYGAADSYTCVAHTNFDEFVEALRKEKQPKLKGKRMKIK